MPFFAAATGLPLAREHPARRIALAHATRQGQRSGVAALARRRWHGRHVRCVPAHHLAVVALPALRRSQVRNGAVAYTVVVSGRWHALRSSVVRRHGTGLRLRRRHGEPIDAILHSRPSTHGRYNPATHWPPTLAPSARSNKPAPRRRLTREGTAGMLAELRLIPGFADPVWEGCIFLSHRGRSVLGSIRLLAAVRSVRFRLADLVRGARRR